MTVSVNEKQIHIISKGLKPTIQSSPKGIHYEPNMSSRPWDMQLASTTKTPIQQNLQRLYIKVTRLRMDKYILYNGA